MSTQALENVNHMSPFTVLECLVRNAILIIYCTRLLCHLSTGEKGYGTSPAFATTLKEVLLEILTNLTIKLPSLGHAC